MNGFEAASPGGGSAPGQAGFFTRIGSLPERLHHVVCILVSTVDNGLSDSVAAPWIKTHPFAALGPAAPGSDGGPELLSTFTVTSLSDSGAHSLRAGIQSGDATIAFAPGLHGTITLTSALLPITGSVTIDGPGANKLSVSGNNAYRVFDISGSASVSIAGLTITDGLATSGGGILLEGSAALSISNCTLTDNEALGIAGPGSTAGAGFGGGIEDTSSGALTVTNCTFDANKAIAIGPNTVPGTPGSRPATSSHWAVASTFLLSPAARPRSVTARLRATRRSAAAPAPVRVEVRSAILPTLQVRP